MADLRAILSTLLYCLWWPTSKLISAVQTLLSPLWTLLHFIFLPAIYLVHALLTVLLLPFRLHILDRIETIYIWLGIAGLIGCIAGAVVFLLFKAIASALNIDRNAQSKPRTKGRTVKEYRATRLQRNGASPENASRPVAVKLAAPRRRGISSQAIMEEESES